MGVEPLLEHLIPFFLVLSRLAGLFIIAPLLGSVAIPIRARALLAISLAVAIYPLTPAHTMVQPSLTLFGLIPVILFETLIGIVIGFTAALPVICTQIAGQLMGYQMGLSLAQTFNPELDSNADVIGQMLFFLATGLFIIMGGVESMFEALLSTFSTVPPGAFRPGAAPLELFTSVLASGFNMALRISAPVLAMTLLLLLAMGFIMKTMPQINILSIGFALKIVGSLIVLVSAIVVMSEISSDGIADALNMIHLWTSQLGMGSN